MSGEPDDWGAQAEAIAADYLTGEGYVVRERNWRPKNSHLEVDIITQRDGRYVALSMFSSKNPSVMTPAMQVAFLVVTAHRTA